MSYSFALYLKDFASGPVAKITTGISNLQSKVESFSSKAVSDTNKAGEAFDGLEDKVKGVDDELEDLGETSQKTGGRLNGLGTIAARVFAAIGFAESVRALFNIGVEAEQANVKFQVLLGSVDKANAMLNDLTAYADQTPYSFEGLQKGAETMLGFGIAHEKIIPSMKMLGDVAMGNDEKLSGLSLVYSQIMATGKLMGQDLLQLINQGFNPLQIISEQTGISMGVLKDKMEKGAISADMVTEAFRIATSDGGRYYGMTEQMAESAGGKFSTMMDTFAGVTKKVGLHFAEWVKPLFDVGTAFATQIIPFLQKVREWLPSMQTFGTILQFVAVAAAAVGAYMLVANASTIAYTVAMKILSIQLWLAQAAQWALNFAMSINPIGIVIAAIVALVGVVVVLWKRFGWFRGAVLGVWEVLKGLGTMIKNYVINRFTELLAGITGIGKALVAFIKGDFEGAMKMGGAAAQNLIGKNSAEQALKDGKTAFTSFNKGWEEGNKEVTPKTVKTIQKTNDKVTTVQPKSTMFDSLLGSASTDDKKKGKKSTGLSKTKDRAESVISGGSKQTTINISINKLQDQTVINVDSSDKGLSNLGDKVQEVLLRAVNSVNQMQTT